MTAPIHCARGRAERVGAALLVTAALAISCGGHAAGPVGRGTAVAATGPVVRSNVVRGDYVGSQACAGCHPTVYAAWKDAPMHNMTRLPAGAVVRAPWEDAHFRFKNDEAIFERAGDQRLMQLRSSLFGDHLYRITKIIGGRYREDFAGLEVSGPESGARVIGDPHAELVLPVSYVFASHSFRLKGYSVMVRERPGLRAGGVWNETCIACHNTAPQLANFYSVLHGPGAPAQQAVLVDRLLPRERRLRFRITDHDGLDQAARAEVAALGGVAAPSDDTHALLADAARASHDHLGPETLVEVGIGCEACHGGSREHVERGDVLPSFEPRSRFLEALPANGQPTLTRAEWINRTCARCHQVLFTRYPYTWEGGVRRQDPGGSHVNSGEARDFLLGGCAQQMSCTTCHDPHGADRPERLAALATPAGNATCTTCHQKLATPTALHEHAHHDPNGAAGSCVACHMPRKNMGLGYQLTRYHRIGSPTDRARVEGDRPLECALCHPKASVGELVGSMETWWGKRYDRAALERLYGDLNAPVLTATLARGKPHEQVTAMAVLGEAHAREAAPQVAAALVHPYPLVRYYARRALEQMLDAPVPVDLDRTTAEIRAAIQRWRPNTPLPAPSADGEGRSETDED